MNPIDKSIETDIDAATEQKRSKPQTHTTTPWTHNPEMSDSSISGADGVVARACHSWDAAFIVRAVNCHEELLIALKTLRDGYKRRGLSCDNADRAIAKAEGK